MTLVYPKSMGNKTVIQFEAFVVAHVNTDHIHDVDSGQTR